MRLPELIVLCPVLLAQACAPGEGAVYVTVDAEGRVRGVDHLRVSVENAGQTSLPVTVPLAGAPVDIPPPQSFQLRFDKSRRGEVRVRVAAVDVGGRVLAESSAAGDLQPSRESEVKVLLPGDVGGMDMGVPPDMTVLPPPAITGVTPPRGPTTGGVTLALSGSNFFPGLAVSVAGVAATGVNWISASQVTAVLPVKPGALGQASIEVTNPDGQTATLPKAFSYFPGTLGFLAGRSYEAGSATWAVIARDVNGDQKIDLVTANGNSKNISVLLGHGDGTFESQRTQSAGAGPTGLVADDFNGDGRVDLAVSNGADPGLVILLGNGDGSFQNGRMYSTGLSDSSSIAEGDLNGDGRVDLVVGNVNGNSVSILPGDGNGTFGPPILQSAGMYCPWVAARDLNGDGFDDLAIACLSDDVTVLFSDGSGMFQSPKVYANRANPGSVIAEDFDGDRRLDLAVTSVNNGSVDILLNDGLQGFKAPTSYGTGMGARAAGVADVNADGIVDLVVTNGGLVFYPGANNLTVLIGRGDGTFASATDFATGSSPQGVALADFDGDGRVDIVTANAGSNDVSVLINSSQ